MCNLSDILVIMESIDDRLDPGSEAAWGLADHLRTRIAGTVRVLLLGSSPGAGDTAAQIACRSGYDVTYIADPAVADHTHEAYQRILVPRIQAAAPALVIAANTACGAEWAPSVAVAIHAGCITGVDHVDSIDGSICFFKDLYGGRVKGKYGATAGTTIVTVQPGSFQPQSGGTAKPGTVTEIPSRVQLDHTQFIGVAAPMPQTIDFNDAQVIVAAGMGIGERDDLKWIDHLASLFSKAAVGGTRLVCDRNWLGCDRQIGVTGVTVAPALYIACGISGAAQHRMGMRGSGFVVAINRDPYAPIFAEADIGIVEDLVPFIQQVIKACEPHEGPV
jgi:electron transfer flavoprotein alpha subunit